MNLASNGRAPDIAEQQLSLLMRELGNIAGITIDSTPSVIGGHVRERMDYLGLDDVDSYLTLFDSSISARAEWLALTDLLTIKETRFFRQPAAFACLADYFEQMLDAAPATGDISLWSAGCSTGQELYSMAMVADAVIARGCPWLDWSGYGSDISLRALARSREAVYSSRDRECIPEKYREQFLDPKLGDRWKVVEDIRARTHFFHGNLLHVDSAPYAEFNVIFCQNVLIYFARDKQRWIIDQLVERLRPGGLLVLGAGEDVNWRNTHVERLQWPGVCAYKKTGE